MMAFGESLVISGKTDRSLKSFMTSVGERGGTSAGAEVAAKSPCVSASGKCIWKRFALSPFKDAFALARSHLAVTVMHCGVLCAIESAKEEFADGSMENWDCERSCFQGADDGYCVWQACSSA
jgi:hypothetical protein